MKTIRALLAGLVCSFLLTGCVAIPPLISVEHSGKEDSSVHSRISDLERRIQQLEAKQANP